MGGRVSRQRVGDQLGKGQQQQDGCNEGGVINNTISIVPHSPSSNVLVATPEGREGQVEQIRSPPRLTSPASSGVGSSKGRSVRSRSFSHSPNERTQRTRHPDDNASTLVVAAPWYSCCASAADDETIAMPGAGTRGASMTQRTNGMSEVSDQHYAQSGSPLRNGRGFAQTRKLSVDTADAFSPPSTQQLPHTLTSPSPPPIRIVRARSQSGDFTLGAMKLAYLRASILGQLLTDPELFSFADDCDLRTFEKGQVIYAQGQSIVGAGQESCLYLMCCGTADVEVDTRGGSMMNHSHHLANTSQQLPPHQPSSPFLTPTAHGPSSSLNEASLLHSTRARQASLAAARHWLDTNTPTNANAPTSASPSASNLPPNLPRRPSASTPGSRRPSLTGTGPPPSAVTANMSEDHLCAVASAITPPASATLAAMKRRNSLSPSPSPHIAPTTPVQDHLQHQQYQQHQLQQPQQQPYRSRIGSIPTATTVPPSNQDSQVSTRRNSTRLQSSFLSTGTPKGMGSETPMVASVRGSSITAGNGDSALLTVTPTATNTTTNSFRSSATSSTRAVPSTMPLRPRTLKQPGLMSQMNLDEGPFLNVSAATCAGMQSSTSTWNQKTQSLQQQQSSNSPYSSSPPSPSRRATLAHSSLSTVAVAPQQLPQTHRIDVYRHGRIFGLETMWIIPPPHIATSNDLVDATKSHQPPPRRLTLPPVLKSHHSSSSSVTFSPALPLLPSPFIAASPPTITSALPRSTRTLSVEVSEREESRVGQEIDHSRNESNQDQVQLQNRKIPPPSNLSDHISLAPPTAVMTPASSLPAADSNKITTRLSSVIASGQCTCLTITQQKLNAFFVEHPTMYESVTMCFGANLLSTAETSATTTAAANSFNSHPFLSQLSQSNRALLVTLMNPLRLSDSLGKVLFEEGSGGGCNSTIAKDEALYYTILHGDVRLTIPTRGSATTRGSIIGGGGGSGSRDFTPTNKVASTHFPPPSPKLQPAPPVATTTPMLIPMSTPMPTRSLTLSSQSISPSATPHPQPRLTSGGSFIFNGTPSSSNCGIIDKDLTAGQWFGELSPLLQIKRTGTATINTPSQCTLLTIEKPVLHSFMNIFPETWHAFFQTISNPNGSGNTNNNNTLPTPTAASFSSSSSSSTPLHLSNFFLLHLPVIQDQFYRFCEKEHSCENLEFMKACEEFKVRFRAAELVMEMKEQVKKGRRKQSDVVEEQELESLPGSTAENNTVTSPPPRPLSAHSSSLLLSHARSLYDQYISPSAPSQVNLRSIVTNILRLKLASGVIVSDMFTMASDEIIALMCADSFTRFRKSDMFVQALEKMSQQREEQQVEGEQYTTDTVSALPLKPPSGANSKTSSVNASTCNTPKHQPLQHPSQLPPRSPITRTPSAPPLFGRSPSSAASIAPVTFTSPAIVAVEYIDVKDLPNKLGSNELREYDQILKKRRESVNLSSLLGSSPLSSHSIAPHHLSHLESFELSNLPPLPALPNSRSPSHNSRMLTPLTDLARGSGKKQKSSAAVAQTPSPSQHPPTVEPQLSSYPSSQMYATHNKLHELQKQSDLSPSHATSTTAAFTPAAPTESTSPTTTTVTSPRIIISPRRITIPLRRADSTPTSAATPASSNPPTITPKLMTPTVVSTVTTAITDADY